MGKQEIVSRILSDAEAEAEEIVNAAKARAEEIVNAAKREAEKEREEAAGEAEEVAVRIKEGRAASARLDSAKVLLAEKRRVIDGVYLRALAALLALNEHDSLRLMERLLTEYAEEGDEIVLAENFPYAEAVGRLPVVKQKGLRLSKSRLSMNGGCLLRGEKSDKDLSYSAVLEADKEAHQSEIALALFGVH